MSKRKKDSTRSRDDSRLRKQISKLRAWMAQEGIEEQELDWQFKSRAIQPEHAERRPAGSTRYALIVGINQFQDGRLMPLAHAVNDAREMHHVLASLGRINHEDIKLLLDEEATLNKLKFTINELINQLLPEDEIIIFIATHGHYRPDK
ncbi:MAG: caspase family protein, partial [Methanobacteriota archaeon]